MTWLIGYFIGCVAWTLFERWLRAKDLAYRRARYGMLNPGPRPWTIEDYLPRMLILGSAGLIYVDHHAPFRLGIWLAAGVLGAILLLGVELENRP